MFKYFPTNYVWNLSVNLAIEVVTHQCGAAGHDPGFGQANAGAAGDDQAK